MVGGAVLRQAYNDKNIQFSVIDDMSSGHWRNLERFNGQFYLGKVEDLPKLAFGQISGFTIRLGVLKWVRITANRNVTTLM